MSQPPGTAQQARRRAPTACRPCRKQRKKCIHVGLEPCQACVESNMTKECSYVERGEQNVDRQFRHPRMRRADRLSRNGGNPLVRAPARGPGSGGDQQYLLNSTRSLLPDTNTILIAVDAFFRKFNQLSFLSTDRFAQQVREDVNSVSAFLLCSIVAVSARYVRMLRDHYGGGMLAVANLTDRAEQAGRLEIFEEATLERCQAFLLLTIAQQGSGRIDPSYMSARVALNIAVSLGLHREQAYERMMSESIPQARAKAESARRTFWFAYGLNKSICSRGLPITLQPQDITTYSLQDDIAFDSRSGIAVTSQEALVSTSIHGRPPSLASYLQILDIWGEAARLASCREVRYKPARSSSSIAQVLRRLDDWERGRPLDQGFSSSLLGGYRRQSLDLAYLDIHATFRLCHIVLRKAYLNDIVQQAPSFSQIPDDEVKRYWDVMKDLFVQVRHLFHILDSRFEYGHIEDKVGNVLTCFMLYTVGVMATYLFKCPLIDAHMSSHGHNEHDRIRDDGLRMYTKVSYLLRSCQDVWPPAGHWHTDLESWHHAFNADVIRARVDTVRARGARGRNGAKSSPRHQHFEGDLQPSKKLHETFENFAYLPPLQSTLPSEGEPESLALPPLKGESFDQSARGSPSLPSPPSGQSIDTSASKVSLSPQNRPLHAISNNHKPLQAVLDHRPYCPHPYNPAVSAGLDAPTWQQQSHSQDPVQPYRSAQCSSYDYPRLPSISPSTSDNNNYKGSPSSTPSRAQIAGAAGATAGLEYRSRDAADDRRYSYTDNSDDEGDENNYSRSEDGLNDGFEHNLEGFLHTGAIWAATAGARASPRHHADAAAAAASRDEQIDRYAVGGQSRTLDPGSGLGPGMTSASGGVGSSSGLFASMAASMGTGGMESSSRPFSGPSSTWSSLSLGRHEERGSAETGAMATNVSGR
ncbi:uncharacterized protein B0I36DRAFT_314143 [Microdochium trichocladiopsis]|uniref:Zn(2)-C6 fungal-type domain-containing protein n=1 Tax=Microdochium trichocladiopsis TaxID=1682393 RepID=A0A9P8YB68_9PEZI|nr:uncharacterized protein B0I36DRAFT_314143 [Microdochium trichocladiopsis]KAH7037471.1 hypothetical protein B0I36DRAFT_314143 [Microdochium trichocladiopsis]